MTVLQVHFLLTRGELTPQYRRGLETAKMHGPVTLWVTDGSVAPEEDGFEVRKKWVPDWLRDEHPAHQFDVLALDILAEHGGISLGLDTISLRPVGDLLEKELVVGCDVPIEHYLDPAKYGRTTIDHPYTNTLISDGEGIINGLYEEAARRVIDWPDSMKKWGYTSVRMLTGFVRDNPDKIDVAPFPTLCGWEGSYIWKYYLGVEEPAPETRIIHLFSSAYPELFWEGRADRWLAEHPDFWQHTDMSKMPDWPHCVGAVR